MRRSLPLLFATALGAVATATPLHAQIVDHAALAEAFGEPITTSVTGKPQRASEAPASVTIITRDQIARSPARNVPDLLKVYAGIDVNRWTAGQSDVAVRGGVQTYNPRLLVLVDGRQVYLDHYGMTNWNLLGVQIEEIEQIELVRGPASALFGFNAASGVVNIVTTGAGGGLHADATVEAGTHGYARFSGAATIPLAASVGLKIAGGHQEEDERDIPAALYQPPTTHGVAVDQLSATLAIQADTSTSIELNGGLSGNRQLEFLPSQILTEQRFRNQTVGLVVNRDMPWGSLSARTYTNWMQVDYGVTTPPTDSFNAVADVHMANRITVVAGSALVQLGDAGTLRIGTEYRNNQLIARQQFSDRIGYQVAAANLMIETHPVERVGLTGAVRIDHLWLGQGGTPRLPQLDTIAAYRRALTPVSFNAATTLQVGETGRFRINGGRGFQLPSLTNLGFRVQVPAPDVPVPVYFIGDPRLAPVRVWSGEVGYAQAAGTGLRFEATLFYTRTDRIIASPGGSVDVELVLTPAPVAVTRFANVGAFSSYGVELGASGTLAPGLGWSANYSLAKVDEDIPANRNATFYALFPESATPRHHVNLDLSYVGGGWSGTALAHLVTASKQSSFLPTTELIMVRIPTTVTVDARIGRALARGLSLYAAGENLANARGAYASPIPSDRRLRVGVSATF